MLFSRSRRLFGLFCVLGLICVLSFGTVVAMRSPVSAQSSPASFQTQVNGVENSNGDGKTATDNYWTAERMRNAQFLPLPVPTSSNVVKSLSSKTGTSVSTSGKPPTANVKPDPENLLFTPIEPVNSVDTQFRPLKAGTSGTYFTSSRLIPLAADVEYPYSTVGKLFFTQPDGGDFVCSGSVISPRIILTAGHCVHSGDSSGYFTNFLFIPAYRNGGAPYQLWTWTYVTTTTDWMSSGGTVPNAADYGMIEIADNSIGGVTLEPPHGLSRGILKSPKMNP